MERPIEATCAVAAPFDLARAVLADDPAPVLCDSWTEKEQRKGRCRVALAVDLGGGMTVSQEVALQFGVVQWRDAALALPVSWEATGHHRLLPTLDGTLEVARDAGGTLVRLRGAYSLPLGVLGRFGDALAGQRLARLSVTAFVEQLGARVDEAVRRRVEAELPAPLVVNLDPPPEAAPRREVLSSEHYIG